MTVRRLLNTNALFTLVLGLVLLLNGLLGPRFPFGAALAAALGVLLLVASMFLGQGGMGKGPLVTRVRFVGRVNLAAAAVLLTYAILGLDNAARLFVIVVAIIVAAVGGAQVGVKASPLGQPVAPTGRRRASTEELRVAIGRQPSTPPVLSSDDPPLGR